jgi:hypothetical protein
MQGMRPLERLFDLVDRLPESTNSIHCRWFQAIVVTCFFVILFALFDMRDVTQNIALIVAAGIGGFVVGMRRTDNNGDITCRT